MVTDSPARATMPMKVANMAFLLNKLGDDCGPLQYVRELTQNGLDGIKATGVGGEIVWDVAWQHLDLSGVFKLCCIDTGIGMTGPEMVRYINELSSSMHQQSATGNFGVGAKIAAISRNPEGLIYMSWKDGIGHMIHLWFDQEAQIYGLKRWPSNGGEFWTRVSDDLKPDAIDQHGTVVTLLGRSVEEDTMEPVNGAATKSRWMFRYLNSRYFRFPQGVTVRAREGWAKPRDNSRHNFLRVVDGQGAWLDAHAQSSGVVALTDAVARWWLLSPDVEKYPSLNNGGGHVAALFQDELYEMTAGRAGLARLQGFGVIFGADRVVIYIEPTSEHLSANTARTQLLIAGEPLDWAGWASEFRECMPEELVALQEEIGAQSSEKDHKKAIRDRLKQIQELLKFSRFNPMPEGQLPVDLRDGVGGKPEAKDGATTGHSKPGNRGGKAGDIYALFAEAGEIKADPFQTFAEPNAKWITIEDGSRSRGDLEDRAAKFIPHQNLLLINGDFRVFTDMMDRWAQSYTHVAGAKGAVKEAVHEWFEQQLVEAVMSAQALKTAGQWSADELQELWTEEALTAAVLPRWHIDQAMRRVLGMKFGSLKTA